MTRWFLILLTSLPCLTRAATNSLEHSIVDVLVTAQRPDPRLPWRSERPALRSSYGVVVAPGLIVTTEDTVRNAMLVEIRRPGQPAKITAKVLKADPRVNAALLTIPRDAAAQFIPLPWDGGVSRNDKVILAQFDNAGQLQTGEGRITETAVSPLPNLPHSVLTFSILSELKMEHTGAPVLNENRLVGLAMRFDPKTQITQALPASLLKRFVEDVTTPPYKGFASAGVFCAPLIDPSKRHFYGLPDNDVGTLILKLTPDSGAAKTLAPGDVILRWDGFDIDSQGFYPDPDFGRLAFSHLIAKRYPGNTVSCTVLRNHQRLTVDVVLDAYDDSRALIPQNIEGRQAQYLVEGGILLRELTADYLMAPGPRWMVANNPRFVNLFLSRSQFPDKPGDRVVIMADILPDMINKGYQQIHDDIVTKVNGQPISSLKDVFAIRRRDGAITRITLTNMGVDIVLDPAALEEANRRISKQYRIHQLMLEYP
jgi:S1-C subfamily serine protease